MNFTEEQLQIFRFIEHGEGHGIIDAVAGAGKTTTIMECARFVKKSSEILFCAFNNSISREIANKFQSRSIHGVTVKTIHALGRQILLDHINYGDLRLIPNKYDDILKSVEIQDVLAPYFEGILNIYGYRMNEFDEQKKFAVKKELFRINSILININQKYRATLTKNEFNEFERLVVHFGIFNQLEREKTNFQNELKLFYECHKILLNEGNNLYQRDGFIDFTDMLYIPHFLDLYPLKKFDFLFVDECQDLSKSQLAIVLKYGKKNSRVLAVGDPFQSIYGFTGADIESFQLVGKMLNAQELPLTNCFRCPTKVIGLARSIREDMTGSKNEEGVVESIKPADILKLSRPGDLIISRFRAPIVMLIFNFIDKDIKVHVHEDEVKEIINEIKNVFKTEELYYSISSTPGGFDNLKAKVQNRWNRIIENNSKRIPNVQERNFHVIHEKNYLEWKLNFLQEKYEQWSPECQKIKDVIDRIKEFITDGKNGIKLSTIHRAKGLENKRVFILDFDTLPFIRLSKQEWEVIQETNLKYVAITRALEELYLVENPKTEINKEEGSLFDKSKF